MSWIISEVFEIPIKNGSSRRMWRFDHKFHYQEAVSFNAFFFGSKRNHKGDELFYYAQHLTDYEIHRNVWAKTAEKHGLENYYPDSSTIQVVEDLWRFYKIIGFDYKTKKWI